MLAATNTNIDLLRKLLIATDKANALAAEQVKALQEQNEIHRTLVKMQQEPQQHFHAPVTPSSGAQPYPPSSINTPMSASATRRLELGAQLAVRLAMLAPARSPRVTSSVPASASSPNLHSLASSAAAKDEVPLAPLSPIFSPANAESAAAVLSPSTATAANIVQTPGVGLSIKIDSSDGKSSK